MFTRQQGLLATSQQQAPHCTLHGETAATIQTEEKHLKYETRPFTDLLLMPTCEIWAEDDEQKWPLPSEGLYAFPTEQTEDVAAALMGLCRYNSRTWTL